MRETVERRTERESTRERRWAVERERRGVVAPSSVHAQGARRPPGLARPPAAHRPKEERANLGGDVGFGGGDGDIGGGGVV